MNAVTLERIVAPDNLKLALDQVMARNAPPGLDGMSAEQLPAWLKAHHSELTQAILSGKYRPMPARRITRKNGNYHDCLNACDLLVQAAVAQVLSQELAALWSEHRHCSKEAVQIIEHNALEFPWLAAINGSAGLKSCNHSKLLQSSSSLGIAGYVVSLIHKMLLNPVSIAGKVGPKTTEGMLSSGSLRSLLIDVLFHELDQALAERGKSFVRVGACVVIQSKSAKAAERTLANTCKFIGKKLFVSVAPEECWFGLSTTASSWRTWLKAAGQP